MTRITYMMQKVHAPPETATRIRLDLAAIARRIERYLEERDDVFEGSLDVVDALDRICEEMRRWR